ncbi:NAD-dependent epimerase/dehydratase family protein [Planctomycetes bacterium Pan216]
MITGGAGFVGANLAIRLREHSSSTQVTVLDNLCRRGSELNLARLAEHGITFVHGDIRCPEDIVDSRPFDLLIDCSAQPSVHAGLDGSPMPVVRSNLDGTVHCAEAARRHDAALLFLSTSRVYPIQSLNELPYQDAGTRFQWTGHADTPGFSEHGVAEEFPLTGARSLYGATKLASELVLQEYAYSYQMPVLINRCGILTGPWQMGKVDQGVITYWIASHLFGRGLRYTGFGGDGKQVRDLLHVDDLFDLIVAQIGKPDLWDGRVYNVGGGNDVSTSLCELTERCREVSGSVVPVEPSPETSSVDLRIYVSDSRRVSDEFGWRPQRGVGTIVEDIWDWMAARRELLAPVFG